VVRDVVARVSGVIAGDLGFEPFFAPILGVMVKVAAASSQIPPPVPLPPVE